jgi:hypothetical protein
MFFFRLSTWALVILVSALVLAATVIGLFVGRSLRHLKEDLREPFGVLQAALLGVVGLLLAFGLALAVGRYEDRREAVVDEANAIEAAFLRAQTLAEPVRSQSLALLKDYTDTRIALSHAVPESPAAQQVIADGEEILRELWALGGQVLDAAPIDNAPRLYVESLNETIDMNTVRVSSLNNRVPGAVLALEVLGAAFAMGLLAVYLSILGRGVAAVLLGSILVTMLLLVTFDLDRPTRGVILVPDAPLTRLRTSMDLPPAASAPGE